MLDREIELITAAGKTGKLPLSQAGRVQELLNQASSADGRRRRQDAVPEARVDRRDQGRQEAQGLKATLRPYQEQGFSWLQFLHEIGSGGVLADDMGLGKTVQTIALLLHLKAGEEDQAAARR